MDVKECCRGLSGLALSSLSGLQLFLTTKLPEAGKAANFRLISQRPSNSTAHLPYKCKIIEIMIVYEARLPHTQYDAHGTVGKKS